MPSGKALSVEQKAQIRVLLELGHESTYIGGIVGCSASAVRGYKSRLLKPTPLRPRGRKRKVDDRTARQLVRAASNSTTTCAKLASQFCPGTSRETVRRVLIRTDIFS